eukprot:2271104-Rhodomonas_salina.1
MILALLPLPHLVGFANHGPIKFQIGYLVHRPHVPGIEDVWPLGVKTVRSPPKFRAPPVGRGLAERLLVHQ